MTLVGGDGDFPNGKVRISRELGLDGGDDAGVRRRIGHLLAKVARLAPHDFAGPRQFVLDLLGAQVERFQLGLQRIRQMLSRLAGGGSGLGGGGLGALFRLGMFPRLVLDKP